MTATSDEPSEQPQRRQQRNKQQQNKTANLLPQSVPLSSNAGGDNKAPLSRPAGTGDHKMRLNLRRYNLSGQVIRSGLARKHRGQSPTLHAWRSPPQAQNRRA